MADPQRLLEDPEASPLGRALLASADGDGPSAESRARLAGRLGIAASLAITTTSTQGLAAAVWWKIGAVLLALGGVVTALAVSRTSEPSRVPPPLPPPAVVAKAAPAPAPAPVVAPAPAPTTAPAPLPIEAPPLPPAPPEVAVVRPRPQPSPPSPTKAPAVVEDRAVSATPAPVEVAPPPPDEAPAQVDARRLAAEVAALDRARAALRIRDFAATIAALDEYRRTFPDGALLAGAEVVHIEALVQRGDTAGAAERARAFLARFPSSPLARRVRSIALKETPP
ncbi:MAG: hypothetical protein KIT31_26165 [Deltaproteobacteria bacterium]|nr:hypothetical protein [Deltaproteobacteria bacterium]